MQQCNREQVDQMAGSGQYTVCQGEKVRMDSLGAVWFQSQV